MNRTASYAERARRRHAGLLSGCALALALAAMPQAALAQDADKGFQGSATYNPAAVNVFTGGTGSKFTQIDVTAPQTVITWTPHDPATSGTIDFLPNGYTAAFTSSTQGDYTVLNRILPGGTATIGIDGNITSSVSNGDGQSPGGNVWFYTPNGFVVGKSATIQVGGLVMTTNDITYSIDPDTGIANFYDANGAINFRGPDGSKGSIVNSGSISASNYIALVAPRIVQNGTVSADRQIALVAAEQVDLTINAGNFDIAIGEGTTDANGIVHNGMTTGAASAGSFDPKAIQFVAVPKNTALTMLLSGSIGYTPASFVYDDGASITLTAGSEGSPDGNISIGEADFSSQLNAHATGDLTVAPPAPGPFTESTANTIFESYTNLSGDKSVRLTAAGGTRIEARNGLSVYSYNEAQGGGAISIEALAGGGLSPAGVVDVTGGLFADSSHDLRFSELTIGDGTRGIDAHAGSIGLFADGGQIKASYIDLSAGAYGGYGTQAGGDGYGGTIDITAAFGGSIVSDYVSADAPGHGGASYEFTEEGAFGGQGGVGRAGAITIADSGGTPLEDPSGGLLGFYGLDLDVSAVGGNSLGSASGLGGDAFGGTIDITLDRQNQTFGYIEADARAVDGDGGAEDPLGGTITMKVGGGTALALDSLDLDASIQASINSPAGAFGRGGTIDVTVTDGASVVVNGYADLSASADVTSYYYDVADSSPDLTGGVISLIADNGSFQAGNIYVDASAYNVGANLSAGFAKGGTATVRAANGGTITAVGSPYSEGGFGLSEGSPGLLEIGGGYITVEAEGYGTGGGSANLVTGGDITLAAESGGTISAGSGSISLYAGAEYGIAQGGQANGVTAQGGTIAIDAVGGTIATGIYADASGQGGEADFSGGSGTGGAINVRVLGGTLVNSLYAYASGSGGFTAVEGDGGDGIGGSFSLTSDADATFTDFGLSFYGDGSGGSTYLGTGGDGYGGSAQIDVIGGTHTWYEAYISGYGYSALSYGEGSLAGSAYGSVDGLDFHVGGGADLTLYYLGLNAQAAAGADGDGNEAIGGNASLLVDQLATLSGDSISLNATGMLVCGECSYGTFASTPDAQGGTVSAIADSGTITTPFFGVVANGMTGGALTSAGTATGGNAAAGASNGGLIQIVEGGQDQVLTAAAFSEFGGLVIEAQGLGGEGPSAADAMGGTATLFTAGGAVSSPYDIVVSADGAAGNYAGALAYSGTPAEGFNAAGGTASVEMRAGGSGGGAIDAPSLTVNARGLPNGDSFEYPPVQGNGGSGTGGTATLSVAQGSLTTGNIIVNADGIGGSSAENTAGGAAFASGSGSGGTATFALSGGVVTTTDVSVTAQGIGASGQGESEGATPSLAATGTGGTARFIASGGTLEDSGGISLQALGFGGEGAFNPNGGPGGNGGDAAGGTALFSAPAGSSALLGIAGDIRVDASAFGGEASGSVTEENGIGGDATGGDAAMALADIPFTFGSVAIYALGAPGAGAMTGGAIGGSAAFSLIDSSATPAGPRTIDSLDLNAGSFAGPGASSVGGATAFAAQVGDPGSALAITNDLSAFAGGDSGPAGFGFTGSIAGAPVTVGGTTSIITPSDAVLAITGAGALDSTGDLTVLVGGTFASTGAISTDGNALVSASGGIDMTDLAAGGTTSLESLGAVSVSHDLRSVGAVTVLGNSVDLVSLGGLTFADADATAGDLSIETRDDLLLTSVDATGAVTLTSTAGSIHNTGAIHGVGITYVAGGDVVSDTTLASGGALTVDAGGTFSAPGTVSAVGDVSLSADLGMALSGVVSGGTTLLQASDGSLTVDSLTSPGLVTALGGTVTINSPGALNFASARATAGDLDLTAASDLAVAQGGASDGISLASTGGAVSGTGPIVAGGNVAVTGDTGIALGTLTSGGATQLISANGAVGVTDLSSAGVVTARGRSVVIASPAALSFDSAQATAGNLNLTTAGPLSIAQGAATNALNLVSTSGAVNSTGSLTAGGNVAVSGNGGIALTALTSGGTTSLTSANGTIGVTNLVSTGAVTASGRSIALGSSGALSFTDLDATAGNASVTTAGNLALLTVDATGSVAFTSTGGALQANGAINANGIALTSLATLQLSGGLSTPGAISLTSTSGAVSATGPLAAGGNLAVTGNSGVSLGTATSGGTTSLASANGGVVVSDLRSSGAVTANGRSVTIGSTGALTFADLDATAGAISVQTVGNLGLATANSTGAVNLASSGGSVVATGAVNAGGNTSVSGQAGVSFAELTSGGTTALTSANGAVAVAALTSAGGVTAAGRSVDVRAPASLVVNSADATSGNLNLEAAQNLTVTNASASGAATMTAGGDLRANGLVNAANAQLTGGNVIIGGQVSATGDLGVNAGQLFTLNGLAAGRAIVVDTRDIAIGSTGMLGSRGLTQSIALRNRTASSPMNIGGTGQQGQFSLDQSEASRLFADQQISFVSPGSEGVGGDVRIGDLALAFGNQANLGAGGLLKVDAGGLVEVIGAVTLTTVSDADAFSIDPSRIDVVAGNGSIAMRNASGDLQGLLELEAGTIAVADQPTLDAIDTLSDFSAISSALDAPGAAGPEGGYLQAGTINLIVGDAVYIQNGGATTEYDDRRGFLANQLNIETESSNPAIAINGVIRTELGDLFGLETAGAVSVNGAFAVDLPKTALVTINGCAPGGCGSAPEITFTGPSSDELELVVTTADDGKSGPTGQLVQVQQNQPLITPPMVDEPITGVGNDDLWQVKCAPEGDKGGCPAQGGEE
jgi:filamentous hemagglutinin family protein